MRFIVVRSIENGEKLVNDRESWRHLAVAENGPEWFAKSQEKEEEEIQNDSQLIYLDEVKNDKLDNSSSYVSTFLPHAKLRKS